MRRNIARGYENNIKYELLNEESHADDYWKWRGLLRPEHSPGRKSRIADSIFNLLTTAKCVMKLWDIVPHIGYAKPSRTLERIILADTRFVVTRNIRNVVYVALR